MSSTPISPHGFGAVRGRGYCPEQVEVFAEALSLDRDAAWERAARLTVLAKDMEAEAALLQETVSKLSPQTYEALGEGARSLFQHVQEEAAAVRERARQEAQRLLEAAQAYASEVLGAAEAHAESVRADAEEHAGQRLLVAHAEADEIRIGARRALKEGRGEVLGVLREARQRATVKLAEQAKEFAERWDEVERAEAERAAAIDGRNAGLMARAEAELAEARREFMDAEEYAHRCQDEASARAAEILAAARLKEEQIARETEQVLQQHSELADEMQVQMDNVRSSLTALTGSASGE